MDREAWRAAVHGVTKSQTRLSNWTELTSVYITSPGLNYFIIGTLYLLRTFTHFSHLPPLPLATQSVL